MKNTIATLDYPALATIPAYLDEAHKLNRFTAALRVAEQDADTLAVAWVKSLEAMKDQSESDRISEAETLLSGGQVLGYTERTEANRVLIATLRRAVKAQQAVVSRIVVDLSVKAAERYGDEHKARTRRVVAAVEELRTANLAEIQLRDELEMMGYTQKLPCMRCEPPNDSLNPNDPHGGYVPSWFREASEYLQSPAERHAADATATRREKMARVLAA